LVSKETAVWNDVPWQGLYPVFTPLLPPSVALVHLLVVPRYSPAPPQRRVLAVIVDARGCTAASRGGDVVVATLQLQSSLSQSPPPNCCGRERWRRVVVVAGAANEAGGWWWLQTTSVTG